MQRAYIVFSHYLLFVLFIAKLLICGRLKNEPNPKYIFTLLRYHIRRFWLSLSLILSSLYIILIGMRLMVSGVNFTNGCFCLGKYASHDVDRNGNHIYKHVLNDAYLYYKGTYWAFSSEIDGSVIIKSDISAATPQAVPDGKWSVYDPATNTYVNNPTLRITVVQSICRRLYEWLICRRKYIYRI